MIVDLPVDKYIAPGVSVYNTDCLSMLGTIDNETVDMIFADPPFDVNIKYSGYKDKRADYYDWCAQWIGECFRVLRPTGSFYLMTIPRHVCFKMNEMAKHGYFINQIIWRNVAAVNNKRSFWNSYQPVLLFGKTSLYKFNINAQKRKKITANGQPSKWSEPDAEGFLIDYWDDIKPVFSGSNKHVEAITKMGSKSHPCQMPEMLAGRAILFSTDEGDTVLDPFTGSGTTAASAKN